MKLYHFTTPPGLAGILRTGRIEPSDPHAAHVSPDTPKRIYLTSQGRLSEGVVVKDKRLARLQVQVDGALRFDEWAPAYADPRWLRTMQSVASQMWVYLRPIEREQITGLAIAPFDGRERPRRTLGKDLRALFDEGGESLQLPQPTRWPEPLNTIAQRYGAPGLHCERHGYRHAQLTAFTALQLLRFQFMACHARNLLARSPRGIGVARLAALPDGVDQRTVFLFALLHDCQREGDGSDPGHAQRAARIVKRAIRDGLIARDEKLLHAIAHHADGTTSEDPTIATCWDADRLQHVRPDRRLMSTRHARERFRACCTAARSAIEECDGVPEGGVWSYRLCE